MTTREKNPTLRRLDALVGTWEMSVIVGDQTMTGGRAVFTWQEGEGILQQWSDADMDDWSPEWVANSPFPTSAAIGLEDRTGRFFMLYSDARGVCRLYETSLDDGVWKIWGHSATTSISGSRAGSATTVARSRRTGSSPPRGRRGPVTSTDVHEGRLGRVSQSAAVASGFWRDGSQGGGAKAHWIVRRATAFGRQTTPCLAGTPRTPAQRGARQGPRSRLRDWETRPQPADRAHRALVPRSGT